MISYSDQTLSRYLEKLSAREPVPGGGSAAAVVASMGAALLAMAARYSLGKGKSQFIETEITQVIERSDAARCEFLELSGRDAQVYLDMVRTRKTGDKVAMAQANAEASRVPGRIIRLCQECLALGAILYREGNPHLLSDVKAAEAFLNAAIQSAGFMQEDNA
ncbi:MAG: cyclodeaminase/cyclohydrolase family protein [Candidatus Omnitrophota bacterium]